MKKIYTLLIITFSAISICAQTNDGKSSLKPGQTFKDCPDCPEMVVIPAGSFTMGSTEKELGHYFFSAYMAKMEGPMHRVTVQKFAAGKFDITKGQWAAFVKATNHQPTGGCAWAALPGDTSQPWILNPAAAWNNIGFAQDDDHPVVCITWQDAQDYVQWLSKKTGFTYRLLSEAEWEYAARAGTTTTFPWGDSASHEYANYGTDTTAGVGFAYGRDKWITTSPVGSFPPNQFGLYDMNGNVLQWVEDCVADSYAGLPTDGSAYTLDVKLNMSETIWADMNGKSSRSYRICRGGDAWDFPVLIRSGARNWGEVTLDKRTNYASAGLSLRVARVL